MRRKKAAMIGRAQAIFVWCFAGEKKKWIKNLILAFNAEKSEEIIAETAEHIYGDSMVSWKVWSTSATEFRILILARKALALCGHAQSNPRRGSRDTKEYIRITSVFSRSLVLNSFVWSPNQNIETSYFTRYRTTNYQTEFSQPTFFHKYRKKKDILLWIAHLSRWKLI